MAAKNPDMKYKNTENAIAMRAVSNRICSDASLVFTIEHRLLAGSLPLHPVNQVSKMVYGG